MLVPDITDLTVKSEVQDINVVEIDDIFQYVQLYDGIDTENEKERKKVIKTIESIVRKSPEYSAFIGYLKNNLNLTKCTFHKDVDISELRKTKLEFHHYPFTLYDIVDTVLNKHLEQNGEIINLFAIAEEVMLLHYELKIGLVPLSKTIHELAHAGKKFINLKYVTQSYLKFIANYSQWINPELINNWQNLKDLSQKQDNGELDEIDILAIIPLEIQMKDVELPTEIKVEEEIIA